MAEHAEQARKPARSDSSARPHAAPGGGTELRNRRSETALTGYARLLARRSEASGLAGPVRGPGPQPVQLMPNRTGLPDGLKAGVEALSGLPMDDVRVHRNSSAPAGLGALAYARGSDIHLGPGQDRHLPHEAWHVVQQKQGRVRATRQMKGDIEINGEPALEREADLMGARAASHRPTEVVAQAKPAPSHPGGVVQRYGSLEGYDERSQEGAEPTPEGSIEGLGPEQMVTLARGVSPSQRKDRDTSAIRGSYVGHQKMLESDDKVTDPHAAAPGGEAANDYVKQGKDGNVEGLIEFSSDLATAKSFSTEARHQYLYLVKIARKHLTKGSTGEKGWIARQSAPYTVVHAMHRDTATGEERRISAADLRKASQDEADAEFMIAWKERPDAFLSGKSEAEKSQLRARVMGILKTYQREAVADRDRVVRAPAASSDPLATGQLGGFGGFGDFGGFGPSSAPASAAPRESAEDRENEN